MFRHPVAFVTQLLSVPRQFLRLRNGAARWLTCPRGYRSNTEILDNNAAPMNPAKIFFFIVRFLAIESLARKSHDTC